MCMHPKALLQFLKMLRLYFCPALKKCLFSLQCFISILETYQAMLLRCGSLRLQYLMKNKRKWFLRYVHQKYGNPHQALFSYWNTRVFRQGKSLFYLPSLLLPQRLWMDKTGNHIQIAQDLRFSARCQLSHLSKPIQRPQGTITQCLTW